MYALSPKQIESKLYKTPLQRLRDRFQLVQEVYSESLMGKWWYGMILLALLLTLSLTYMHRVDKKYFYPVAAKWEVQQRGEVGTGISVQNANYKPQ